MKTQTNWKKGVALGTMGVAFITGSVLLLKAPPAAANPVKLSKSAPELVGGSWLNTKGNKPLTLASRRGKVTIVEFWSFSRSDCQANLPVYSRWQQRFAPQGVAVIGVHTPETAHERDPKNVKTFISESGIKYPVLLDAKRENWNRWGQKQWPSIYLVDKKGRVRYQWIGELQPGEDKMTKLIKQLIDETAPRPAVLPSDKNGKVVKSEAQWRHLLTPLQFSVLRHAGTEAAGTGSLLNNHEKGIYLCAGCGQRLFSSDTKFESGTGWPSFYAPLRKNSVMEKTDNSEGMTRTEVLCPRCNGHLGHVFDDGPQPTGLRYCMNSVALHFVKSQGN